MRKERLENYRKIENLRTSKLLVYITSDRRGLETNIAADILAPFSKQLDSIGDADRISLYIYTRGGITLAAWSLVNLIRSFCKDLEVIVPSICHSAGTLICLGANRIIMTKQATLGPIDPSTNGLMNPQIEINNQKVKVPVSVEQINGFLGMARSELKITNQQYLKDILINLADQIHPLTLGEVYRSKSQIQMLAKKLLRNHKLDQADQKKVINFLCSESGSHDYTIDRKEAREELRLTVETPTPEEYNIIKEIYLDIENELELRNPYDPKILLAVKNPNTYSFRRALIESIEGGTDVFLSEGTLSYVSINAQGSAPQVAIQDNRTFEAWRHEN